MPTTTARNYYEQYTGTDAVVMLQSLPAVNPRVFENEWLDFKSGKAVNDPDNLAKLWSKAVGAFANNEGGVLIFGIEADKDKSTGIDAANAIELVPDVNWLVSKLTELSRFATDPPPTGIEYKALPLNDSTVEGFVVCLIPEGKVKPYRSEKADRRFFLRIGDSAKEPTVSMLRQLFYPQVITRGFLNMTVEQDFPPPDTIRVIPIDGIIIDLDCEFVNKGNSTIEHGLLGIKARRLYLNTQRNFDFDDIPPLSILLPNYFHPAQRFKFSLAAKAASGNIKPTFTVTLYQRHSPAIVRQYGLDFTHGNIIFDDKMYLSVQTDFVVD